MRRQRGRAKSRRFRHSRRTAPVKRKARRRGLVTAVGDEEDVSGVSKSSEDRSEARRSTVETVRRFLPSPLAPESGSTIDADLFAAGLRDLGAEGSRTLVTSPSGFDLTGGAAARAGGATGAAGFDGRPPPRFCRRSQSQQRRSGGMIVAEAKGGQTLDGSMNLARHDAATAWTASIASTGGSAGRLRAFLLPLPVSGVGQGSSAARLTRGVSSQTATVSAFSRVGPDLTLPVRDVGEAFGSFAGRVDRFGGRGVASSPRWSISDDSTIGSDESEIVAAAVLGDSTFGSGWPSRACAPNFGTGLERMSTRSCAATAGQPA